MKIISFFLLIFFIASCAAGKERTYIGSTPANHFLRSFLGISFSDSVDFIRWKITMHDDKYILKCNYGIGKPNTNGFMNGGKWIELNGGLKKKKNYYYLQTGNKTLGALELNASLLHLLNEDNSLLVGGGGWSYTLSAETPSASNQINITSKQTILKDSMSFQGRTPCLEFASIQRGTTCYKLKWWIVLYADVKSNKPTTYYLNGTAVLNKGKTGTWTMITGKDGRIIYQLNSDNNDVLYLLKLDENILVFTDKQGKLLVGDENFSFTLNRRW